jgi:hypothetical protein
LQALYQSWETAVAQKHTPFWYGNFVFRQRFLHSAIGVTPPLERLAI